MKLTTKKYVLPFILITILFFLWGFARAILDVLNQHFRDSMDITITESSLIQVTTFIAYFLTAIPAGMFISRFGYRKGVVLGLLLYAIGAFLFIPGAQMGTLTAYLICLFIIGVGLTFLETSANPYATELGPKETATSRLNLSQSFNGLGAMLAPAIIGGFLFTGGDVTMPYVIMGIIVVFVAIIFSRVSLPEIKQDDDNPNNQDITNSQEKHLSFIESIKELFNEHGEFAFGLAALLCYEVAEISINSYFVMFLTGEDYTDKLEASQLLSLALGIFMCGRFIGAWVMQHVNPATVLSFCAIGSLMCMLCTIFGGRFAIYSLVANFAFESIMFPTIFSLALDEIQGSLKKSASSLLMMTPVGGCAFLLMGLIADSGTYTTPFYIPLAAFAIVFAFGFSARDQQKHDIGIIKG